MLKCQFSVRGLLVVVALVAVGCTALINASPLWDSVILTAVLAALLGAVVASACRRGSARAFWLGFGVVGWGYLWLSGMLLANLSTPLRLPMYYSWDEPVLATTRLTRWIYETAFRSAPTRLGPLPVGAMFSVNSGPFDSESDPFSADSDVETDPADATDSQDSDRSGPTVPKRSYSDFASFMCIGESLWALLLAYGGGCLGHHFYVTRNKEP